MWTLNLILKFFDGDLEVLVEEFGVDSKPLADFIVSHLESFLLRLFPLADRIADRHTERHVVCLFQPALSTLNVEPVLFEASLEALELIGLNIVVTGDRKVLPTRERSWTPRGHSSITGESTHVG